MMNNQANSELWRITRLGAKRLPDAIEEITRKGSTGSLTIHFHDGKPGTLEFKEKEKARPPLQLLDKKRA